MSPFSLVTAARGVSCAGPACEVMPWCPPFSLYQLSQAAASIDNRVPTPGSAASADVNAQQLGHDTPVQEVKLEVKAGKAEPECGEAPVEPRPEVPLSAPANEEGWPPFLTRECAGMALLGGTAGEMACCLFCFSWRRPHKGPYKPKKKPVAWKSSRSQWK